MIIQIGHPNKRGGFRVYSSVEERMEDVARLEKRGYNYFVGYVDSGFEKELGAKRVPGLSFGRAAWMDKGSYKKDLHGLIH
jgi:flagellum-specific peptidoglycan hydrolase FlgJ